MTTKSKKDIPISRVEEDIAVQTKRIFIKISWTLVITIILGFAFYYLLKNYLI